jgi:ribbon-helix-helix CopG family protein
MTPQAVHQRVCAWEAETAKSFWELGRDVLFMETSEGWKQCADHDGKPFRSHAAWMRYALPHSHTRGYKALSLYRAMPELPESVVEAVPQETLTVLSLLEPRDRTPELLSQAQSCTGLEFRRQLREANPDLHIPTPSIFKVTLDSDALAIVEEKIKLSGMSRADAVEAAFQDWSPE